MSVPIGIYRIQFGLAFSAESDLPIPEPLYLTNHGEGKQLTLEPQTIGFNQDVNQYHTIKCVPWTYPLTCFCLTVEHPVAVRGRNFWQKFGIPYHCTSTHQHFRRCLPGCRLIPWRSFPRQEPSRDLWVQLDDSTIHEALSTSVICARLLDWCHWQSRSHW